jgi:hypothetical protein
MPSNLQQLVSLSCKLVRQGVLPEANANALIAAAYIDISLTGIKLAPQYLPDVEIQIISDAISSLPQDSNLLPYLVSLLVELSDDFYRKNSDLAEVCLEKIISTLAPLSFNAFSRLESNTKGETLGKLVESGQFNGKISLQNKHSLDELIFLIDKTISEKHDQTPMWPIWPDVFEYEYKRGENLKELLHAWFSSDEPIDKVSIEKLLLCYDARVFPSELLAKIIELVLERKPELKEIFVNDFCETYQTIYDRSPRKSLYKNNLLELMSDLLPILAISSEILVKYELADPHANVHDVSYAVYSVTKALIEGKEIHIKYMNEGALIRQLMQGDSLLKAFDTHSKINPDCQLLFSDAPELHAVPASLAQVLDEKGLTNSFKELLSHLVKINDRVGAHQQRNIALLLMTYEQQITQLIEIMGDDAIAGMKQLVANTVLPLEKMLADLPVFDPSLKDHLTRFWAAQELEDKVFKTFILCLVAINATRHKSHYVEEVGSLTDIIWTTESSNGGKFVSPKTLLNVLFKHLINEILGDSTTELNEAAIEALMQRIPIEKLMNLVIASQRMEHDEYRVIYLEFLKMDLFGERDVDDFLHHVQQDSDIGRDLARHNQAIRTSLIRHDIDPQTALNYRKSFAFALLPHIDSVEQTNPGSIYSVFWSYLKQLHDEIEKIQQSDGTAIDGPVMKNVNVIGDEIKKIVSKMQKKIQRLGNEETAAIELFSNNKYFKSTISNLVEMLNRLNTTLTADDSNLPRTFFEFSGHVCDQFNLIAQPAPVIKVDTKQNYFTVEQWPKERAMTFFLGDEVGCCLGTNGPQFQAIVQRRMDDAMLFHVATDNTTGKPAALIWLYLAETADSQIVLMANFFEVKTKFGQDEYHRKELLNDLIHFTQQYLTDNPGIHGFYMNKLKYGWNIRDLDCYPACPLALQDKLGGPYLQGGIPAHVVLTGDIKARVKLETQQKYYLVSLSETEFRQFVPEILQAVMRENIVPISKLIHDVVVELTKEKIDFDALVEQVIAKHGAMLDPFYEAPLATNTKLVDILKKEYQQAVAPNTSVSTSAASNYDPGLFKQVTTKEATQLDQAAPSESTILGVLSQKLS